MINLPIYFVTHCASNHVNAKTVSIVGQHLTAAKQIFQTSKPPPRRMLGLNAFAGRAGLPTKAALQISSSSPPRVQKNAKHTDRVSDEEN